MTAGLPTRRAGHPRRTVTRVTSAGLATWGAVLLAWPEQVATVVAPHTREPRAWVIRLLGARLLAQHGLLTLIPDRHLVIASATVDGIHTASMLVMAATLPRYRRVTLLSAVVAGAATVAGALAAPRAQS